MAKTETIALANPIELFGKPISHVTVNEPTGYMYSTIGEPRILVATGTGGVYFVEQPQEIARYMEKCIDGDLGGHILKLLSLEDVKEVKQALLSFFERADERIVARKLTSSSSP
jgi:hypothetical protein